MSWAFGTHRRAQSTFRVAGSESSGPLCRVSCAATQARRMMTRTALGTNVMVRHGTRPRCCTASEGPTHIDEPAAALSHTVHPAAIRIHKLCPLLDRYSPSVCADLNYASPSCADATCSTICLAGCEVGDPTPDLCTGDPASRCGCARCARARSALRPATPSPARIRETSGA